MNRPHDPPHMLKRVPARLALAVFLFVNSSVTIGLLGALAKLMQVPLVFPSLGPTAFMVFFSPRSPASSPRNSLSGHAIGILCGYMSLWIFGLVDAPSALAEGVNWPRVLAAALSLALTGVIMVFLNVEHPPAAATTLIVSLGMITEPLHLLIIEIAVLLLVIQALVINQVAGIEYPYWSTNHLLGERQASTPAGPGNS
jgi:CBS domain-containing membrane protein